MAKKKPAPKASRKPKAPKAAAVLKAPQAIDLRIHVDGPAETKAVGRTKYDPAMCEVIIALGRKGKSKTQCAAHLNIARSTFDAWLGQHQSFKDAWELSDTLAEAYWEQIGQDGIAKGHHFGDRTWSLQMRNRFAKTWKENRELELSGVGGAPIQIVMTPSDAAL
jgi:hypothetical protein